MRVMQWGVSAIVALAAVRAGAQPPPVALLADTAAGRQTFESVCARCHRLGPARDSAPEIKVVMLRLQQRFPDRDDFVRQVVQWAANPDTMISVMPRRIREHFGLMPAQSLPTQSLEQVATWLWMVDPPAIGMPARR
jgi:cytochrome c